MNYHLPEKSNNQIKLAEKTAKIWRNKYEIMQVNSFADCFPTDENKTLKNILKNDLGKPAKYLIYDVVLKFAASFNLTNNFREDQIQEFVNDIFEFYPHLTIRDIKFFLHQVKSGNFGQVYNRLDGPLLLGYLKVYSDLRLGEAERHDNENKKVKDINDYDQNIMFQKLAPIFKETQKAIIEAPKISEAQKKQQEIQLKIHNDFCKLHAKQGGETGAMFVEYDGKMLSFEEYYNEVIDSYI